MPHSSSTAVSKTCNAAAMAFSPDMFVGAIIDDGGSQNKGSGAGLLALFFQERLDPLVQLLERHRALEPLAIDKEGRRRIDLYGLHRVALVGGELVEQRLVLHAGLDVLPAHAVELADETQCVLGLAHQALL